MGDSPTPSARVKFRTVARLHSGAYQEIAQGTLVRYVRPEYLPEDHTFGDYNEEFSAAVYSPYGLVLIDLFDLELDYY